MYPTNENPIFGTTPAAINVAYAPVGSFKGAYLTASQGIASDCQSFMNHLTASGVTIPAWQLKQIQTALFNLKSLTVGVLAEANGSGTGY